jgi:hypothetical protein
VPTARLSGDFIFLLVLYPAPRALQHSIRYRNDSGVDFTSGEFAIQLAIKHPQAIKNSVKIPYSVDEERVKDTRGLIQALG